MLKLTPESIEEVVRESLTWDLQAAQEADEHLLAGALQIVLDYYTVQEEK